MAPTAPPPGTPSGTPSGSRVTTPPPAPYATTAPTSVPVTTAASIPVIAAPAEAAPPRNPAPPGRTRHGFALGLAVASVVPAVVLGGTSVTPASAARSTASSPAAGAPASASPAPGRVPACGDPAAKDFPISTRIHGGPDTYASGGGYGTWFLDLTNTTTEPCRAVHPVLVLTDEDRKLTSDQIQLQFSEEAHPGTEHRVAWETTDQDEHIGVFGGTGGDAFEGLTVPAGRTVTLQVRMAFTSDTSPGRITANAAIVQRQRTAEKDDGTWVGESGAYPFTVVDDHSGAAEETAEPPDTTDTTETTEPADPTDPTDPTEPTEPMETTETGEADEPDGTGDTGDTTSVPDGTLPPGLPELAATGTDPSPAPGLTATGLLIGGGAMVVTARRLRRDRP
ncbi:hypothetical protein ACFVWY_19045 [Streptomyces sp. NPDC058195]|uniref:hypothetical protein n=1 Tax=Streptomyces sp. NPDC058195 TaxID=3346375 RepID=UPI0036E91685